ncbi:hypothetical protein TNCV_699381 [Trichonephila clavipes]|nr:hypothetical protein TNCV_699381 [Trichonephila clavipes]
MEKTQRTQQISTLSPPMSSGLTPLVSQTAMAWSYSGSELSSNYTRGLDDGPRHFEPWSSDEDATPSPNIHTIPTGGCLSLDIFNVHRPTLDGGSSAVTMTTRLPRPSAQFQNLFVNNIK